LKRNSWFGRLLKSGGNIGGVADRQIAVDPVEDTGSGMLENLISAGLSVWLKTSHVYQVSTVRSAVIEGMKKYAAAVSFTNSSGMSRVVRLFPPG
jgi:hypothetical protein